MNKNLLTKFFFIALACLILIVFNFLASKTNKNLAFNGVVQNIQYSIKGSATVTINNSVYKLASNNWAFDRKIQVGDSLIKVKNTLVIKLIKKKTNEVLFFY